MTSDPFTYRDALIVQHCAAAGRLTTRVRAYYVGTVAPYAQYPASVAILFIEPRKRRASSYRMYQDNLRYLTIEATGRVVYDSRADVPCDMAAWATCRQEITARFTAALSGDRPVN